MIDSSPVPGKYNEFLKLFFARLPKVEFEGTSRIGIDGEIKWQKISSTNVELLPRVVFPGEELLIGTHSDEVEVSVTDVNLIYYDWFLKRPNYKLHFRPRQFYWEGESFSKAERILSKDFRLDSQSRYFYRPVPGFEFPHRNFEGLSFEILEQIEESWTSSPNGNLLKREDVSVKRLIPGEFIPGFPAESYGIIGHGTFTPISGREVDVPNFKDAKVWLENIRSYFFGKGDYSSAFFHRDDENRIVKTPRTVNNIEPFYDYFPDDLGSANILVIKK